MRFEVRVFLCGVMQLNAWTNDQTLKKTIMSATNQWKDALQTFVSVAEQKKSTSSSAATVPVSVAPLKASAKVSSSAKKPRQKKSKKKKSDATSSAPPAAKKRKRKRKQKPLTDDEAAQPPAADAAADSATPRRRRRKKKKKKNWPKKNLSAFIIFSAEYRVTAKLKFPEKNFVELSRHAGEVWRGFTDEDKKQFYDKSSVDAQRYRIELDVLHQVQKDHPEWSEDEQRDEAKKVLAATPRGPLSIES